MNDPYEGLNMPDGERIYPDGTGSPGGSPHRPSKGLRGLLNAGAGASRKPALKPDIP